MLIHHSPVFLASLRDTASDSRMSHGSFLSRALHNGECPLNSLSWLLSPSPLTFFTLYSPHLPTVINSLRTLDLSPTVGTIELDPRCSF